MAGSTADGDEDEPDEEIRLVHTGELGGATDGQTGVGSQGEPREAALKNLDEAVALHRAEIGRPPADEELLELGIDPDDNATGNQAPPDVLDST
ncbi:MAG: type II toxin-antitoxin system HicB family antitoxin [Haloarculaceae archaeon]